MTQSETFTVKLSQEEILLISMRLRLPFMFGLGEKLLALPQEQLQIATQVAERSLLARDFLLPAEDGNLNLAPAILAVVAACAQPEKTLLVTRTAAGQPGPNAVLFHLARDLRVNHAVAPSGVHTFRIVADNAAMIDGLLAPTASSNYAKPDCPPGDLPEASFDRARQAAHESRPAEIMTLLSTHLAGTTADYFCQTLSHLDATVSVLRLDHADPEAAQAEGFNLLQGGGWQWSMDTSGEPPERTLAITPLATGDLRARLEKLILD